MKSKRYVIYSLLLFVFTEMSSGAVNSEQTFYSFWCGQNSNGPESATAWYDDKVCVMIENEMPEDRDPAAMADFVQFINDLHTAFEQQTGLTNLPLSTGWKGRIVTQIPLDNCGAGGLANHGSTGISVGVGFFNDQYAHCLAGDNTYHQIFFYETNRNYWPSYFNSKFDWAMDSSPSDWGFWTVGMNNAQAYMMCHYIGCEMYYGTGSNIIGTQQWHDGSIAEFLHCYDYTWDTCWIKRNMPWRPAGTINSLMQGFLVYSYDNWGGFDFLHGFYEGIQDPAIPDHGGVFNYNICRDNVYKIWSRSANRDLRNFFENVLRWPLTDEAKSWVASLVDTGIPEPAANPEPGDDLEEINEVNLSWQGHFDADSYNVYFGTNPTPGAGQLQGNQADTVFDPGILAFNTTYYWRIDSINAVGAATGSVWSFTTGPDVAGNTESLANGTAFGDDAAGGTGYLMYSDENIHTRFTDISSTQSDHLVVVRYDPVYGWKLNKFDSWSTDGWFTFLPRGTDVLLAELNFNTMTYVSLEGCRYVIENGIVKGYASGDLTYLPNRIGGSYNYGEWYVQGTFFVRQSGQVIRLPGLAKNARPVPGTPEVVSGVQLTWQPGSYAVSNDVYFGEDPVLDEADFKGNQTLTTYDPGILNNDTTYYWRIDGVNSDGIITGQLWHFTTPSTPVTDPVFVNAATSNTEAADGTTPWLAGRTPPAWRNRDNIDGVLGVYTADEDYYGSHNDYLKLKTTITGLTSGLTYKVYLDFASNGDWSIMGGLTPAAIEGFSGVSQTIGANYHIGTDDASGRVTDTGRISGTTLPIYRAYLGDAVANGAGEIEVFIDDSDNSSPPGPLDQFRCWYDGVEYEIVPDLNPPTPNPSAFASAPTAVSETEITMTAVTGSDASGLVEYYFEEISDNPGASDSGWQTSPAYTDSGLTAGKTYTYRIQMRNAEGLVNVVSAARSAMVKAIDSDEDGIPDHLDNCVDDYNPEQSDMDADSVGDVCDCLPDLTNDGYVTLADLALFASEWGMSPCIAPDYCNAVDFNKSGTVSIVDLIEFAESWLK